MLFIINYCICTALTSCLFIHTPPTGQRSLLPLSSLISDCGRRSEVAWISARILDVALRITRGGFWGSFSKRIVFEEQNWYIYIPTHIHIFITNTKLFSILRLINWKFLTKFQIQSNVNCTRKPQNAIYPASPPPPPLVLNRIMFRFTYHKLYTDNKRIDNVRI